MAMDKIKCIFCDKEFDEDKIKDFGDEYSCEVCYNEVMDGVNKNGKSKLLEYPDGVTTPEELYDYIDENPEWMEKQLGDYPSAYQLIEVPPAERGKINIKYILP